MRSLSDTTLPDIHISEAMIPVEGVAEPMSVQLVQPAVDALLPACILLPEIFGFTRDMLAAANRIARLGFRVVLPDLHYRNAPGLVLGPDDAGRQRGLELLSAMTRD